MKKIAPDIDQLMWTIAETGDQRAIDDFEGRFPDLKYELGKRILVLRELRQARQAGAAPRAVPHFEPRAPAVPSWQRPAWAGAAVLGLAVVALASYALTQSFIRSAGEVPSQPVVRQDDGG